MNDIDDGNLEIGSRVRVWAGDGKTEIGFGRYMGEVPLKDLIAQDPSLRKSLIIEPPDWMSGEAQAQWRKLSEKRLEDKAYTTPRLELDSGEVVYGFQCWWEIVRERHWMCRTCRVTGCVAYSIGSGPLEIVAMAVKDHEVASPHCNESGIELLDASIVN